MALMVSDRTQLSKKKSVEILLSRHSATSCVVVLSGVVGVEA